MLIIVKPLGRQAFWCLYTGLHFMRVYLEQHYKNTLVLTLMLWLLEYDFHAYRLITVDSTSHGVPDLQDHAVLKKDGHCYRCRLGLYPTLPSVKRLSYKNFSKSQPSRKLPRLNWSDHIFTLYTCVFTLEYYYELYHLKTALHRNPLLEHWWSVELHLSFSPCLPTTLELCLCAALLLVPSTPANWTCFVAMYLIRFVSTIWWKS